MILNESTLRKISHLTLLTARIRRGSLKGARRSLRRGSSSAFADYRAYIAGDDLRRLDWNLYARLDRPFVKLFEEEEDQTVYILLDTSQSMHWSSGESHKFTYARRLAAALGAIALNAGDQLNLLPFPSISRSSTSVFGLDSAQGGTFRGPASLPRLFAAIEALQPTGAADLGQQLSQISRLLTRPGLVILISDLLSTWEPAATLGRLQSGGQEIVVIHLLSPEELEPQLAGDLSLQDVETGQSLDVSLDRGLLELYRQRLRLWQEELTALCHKRGIFYLPASTGSPWEHLLLKEMRRLGVVH